MYTRRASIALFSFLFLRHLHHFTTSPTECFDLPKLSAQSLRCLPFIYYFHIGLKFPFSHKLSAFRNDGMWKARASISIVNYAVRFTSPHTTEHIHSCRREPRKSVGFMFFKQFRIIFAIVGFIPRSMRLVCHLFCCEFMLRASLLRIFIYVNIEMARANTRNNLVQCCTHTRQEKET